MNDSDIPDPLESTDLDVGADVHYAGSMYLKSNWANYIILGSSVLSMLWALYQVYWINGIEMTKDSIKVGKLTDEEQQELQKEGKSMPPQTEQEVLDMMVKVSDLIKSGAIEFLKKEYTFLAIFCGIFSILLYATVDYPNQPAPYTTVAFLIGAATSMICGYIGMRIAVQTNVKTSWACCDSIDKGFHVAFRGGQVLGFALVGLGLFVLQLLILFYASKLIGEEYDTLNDV